MGKPIRKLRPPLPTCRLCRLLRPPGHPAVDQSIANMRLSPMDQAKVNSVVNATFDQVAVRYRPNNVAVSMAVAYSAALAAINGSRPNPPQTRELAFRVNDALAQRPQFAQMSDIDKQNSADTWIFETAMIHILREMGDHGDPQSAQQAIELSRMVLQLLNGS